MDYYNLTAAILAQRILYSDGEYSKIEKDTVYRFFSRYFQDYKIQKILRLIEQYAKLDQQRINYEWLCDEINALYSKKMLHSLIHFLFIIVKADNEISDKELKTLLTFLRYFNLSLREINSIVAQYIEDYVPYPFVNDEKRYGTHLKYKKKKKSSSKTKKKRRKTLSYYIKSKTYQYYLILGIPKTASIAQIKRAYRIKVKENHPDLFTNASEIEKEKAKERIRKINQAYEELKRIKRFK